MSNSPRVHIGSHVIEIGPSDNYCVAATKDDNIVVVDSLDNIKRRININGDVDFPKPNKKEITGSQDLKIPDKFTFPLVLRSDDGDLLFLNKSDRKAHVEPEELADGEYNHQNRKSQSGSYVRLPPTKNTGNNAYRSHRYTLTLGNRGSELEMTVEIPKMLEDNNTNNVVEEEEDTEDLDDMAPWRAREEYNKRMGSNSGVNNKKEETDEEIADYISQINRFSILDFERYNQDSFITSQQGTGEIKISELDDIVDSMKNNMKVLSKMYMFVNENVPKDTKVRSALNAHIIKIGIEKSKNLDVVKSKIKNIFSVNNDKVYIGSDGSSDTVPVMTIINILDKIEERAASSEDQLVLNNFVVPKSAGIDEAIYQKLGFESEDVISTGSNNQLNASSEKSKRDNHQFGNNNNIGERSENQDSESTEFSELEKIIDQINNAKSMSEALNRSDLEQKFESVFDTDIESIKRKFDKVNRIDSNNCEQISSIVSHVNNEKLKEVLDTFAAGEIIDMYHSYSDSNISNIRELLNRYTLDSRGSLQTYKSNNYTLQDLSHYLRRETSENRKPDCNCLLESINDIENIQEFSDGEIEDENELSSSFDGNDYSELNSEYDLEDGLSDDKKDINIREDITDEIIDLSLVMNQDKIIEKIQTRLGDIKYDKIRKVMTSDSPVEVMNRQKWAKDDFEVTDDEFKRLLNTFMFVQIIRKADEEIDRFNEIPLDIEIITNSGFTTVSEIEPTQPSSINKLPNMVKEVINMSRLKEIDDENEEETVDDDNDSESIYGEHNDSDSEDDKLPMISDSVLKQRYQSLSSIREIQQEVRNHNVRFGDDIDNDEFNILLEELDNPMDVYDIAHIVGEHGANGKLEKLNETSEKLYITLAVHKILNLSESDRDVDSGFEELANAYNGGSLGNIELIGGKDMYMFRIQYIHDEENVSSLHPTEILASSVENYRTRTEEIEKENEGDDDGFQFGDEPDEQKEAPTPNGFEL